MSELIVRMSWCPPGFSPQEAQLFWNTFAESIGINKGLRPADWVQYQDQLLEFARNRAGRGDIQAAQWLLKMLEACLRGPTEANAVAKPTLTQTARSILAEMLATISAGEDPAKALHLITPGNPKWTNIDRNRSLIGEMSMLIQGRRMTAWAAAEKIAKSGSYTSEKNGQPLTRKAINNIWHKFKEDPDYRLNISFRVDFD